jgi:predicted TPR repeat methyltransferase
MPHPDVTTQTVLRQRETLHRCAAGTVPPNVALMQLFFIAADEGDARRALASAIAEAPDDTGVSHLLAMETLWDVSPEAFAAIRAIHRLAQADIGGPPESCVQQIATLFDRAAAISPEAGVALYSLGDARLLDAATCEVLGRLRTWGLLGPEVKVLDVGCGTGRFLEALAPHVAELTGLDVSEAMLSAARAAVAAFPHVSVVRSSGCDLSAVAGSFDLILAIDTFPYLVQAGVADRHMRDAAARLTPGPHLLLINFSYRGDLDGDRADVQRLADESGLTLVRSGSRDLRLWDGATFLLQARGPR